MPEIMQPSRASLPLRGAGPRPVHPGLASSCALLRSTVSREPPDGATDGTSAGPPKPLRIPTRWSKEGQVGPWFEAGEHVAQEGRAAGTRVLAIP